MSIANHRCRRRCHFAITHPARSGQPFPRTAKTAVRVGDPILLIAHGERRDPSDDARADRPRRDVLRGQGNTGGAVGAADEPLIDVAGQGGVWAISNGRSV